MKALLLILLGVSIACSGYSQVHKAKPTPRSEAIEKGWNAAKQNNGQVKLCERQIAQIDTKLTDLQNKQKLAVQKRIATAGTAVGSPEVRNLENQIQALRKQKRSLQDKIDLEKIRWTEVNNSKLPPK